MNTHSLTHPTTRCKLAGAMRKTIATGLPVYIQNRRGQPYMRLERVVPKDAPWNSGFKVYRGNQDLTKQFYEAMRAE